MADVKNQHLAPFLRRHPGIDRLLRIVREALKTSKAFDKLARTLQYGSAYLLVTVLTQKGGLRDAFSKVKSTTGMTRRILRWGQFVGVTMSLDTNPKHWHDVCQLVSDSSLALFYLVENIIYAAQCGLLPVTNQQMKTLTWLSDFFWLFEVLPLVPKYADLLSQADKKSNKALVGKQQRTFAISACDTFVAAHDLGIQPSVSTPTRHLLGTVTSIIGVYNVYLAAKATVEAQDEKKNRKSQ